LDISAIPLVKELSHLPIIVDPSHATGKRSLIPSMCMASLAAGAHGLMVEVHPNPSSALSDNEQQLNFEEFTRLMEELKPLARCMGKIFNNYPCRSGIKNI
jgi:3-deoxy-7-phosphoheptulonate synthase